MVKSPSPTTMSIKEIRLEYVDEKFSIRLAYSPFDQEDLGVLRMRKGLSVRLPYLPFAVITQKDQNRIVVGDASFHEQLRRTIEQNMGKLDDNDIRLGQFWLADNSKIHDLFVVRGNDSDEKIRERIIFLFKNIKSEVFYSKEIGVMYGHSENYRYYINLESIEDWHNWNKK